MNCLKEETERMFGTFYFIIKVLVNSLLFRLRVPAAHGTGPKIRSGPVSTLVLRAQD